MIGPRLQPALSLPHRWAGLVTSLILLAALVGHATTVSPRRATADPALSWSGPTQQANRAALLRAVNNSLAYLHSDGSRRAYARLQSSTGISHARVQRSLLRFRALLLTSRDFSQFQAALQREFICYQSRGEDNTGRVGFTGYYEPIYAASRVRTAVYRYPLYRVPRWSRAGHMTRLQLEGSDGLHPAPEVRGGELAWLRDRLEAYLVQVEGSARLRLTDGHLMAVSYASHTAYPYTSMGRELVKDGKITFAELTQQALIQYFKAHLPELDNYLPRNQRLVFFRETHGAPTSGSLGVPLTPEHSIATDKALMPPGALALIQVHVTNPYAVRVLHGAKLTRFVLDQDAGDAIRGAARVDIYMGTGDQAGERAGVINSTGSLYYVLLNQHSAGGAGPFVAVPFPDL